MDNTLRDLLAEELKTANKFLSKYEKLFLEGSASEHAHFYKERVSYWSGVANNARAQLFA